MKYRASIITVILLIGAIGNYFRIISDNSIRTVEFLSIFAIGLLAGILLTQISRMMRISK